METERKWGLPASFFKWLAIITMLIDHLGAGLIESVTMNGYGTSKYLGFRTWALEKQLFLYNLDFKGLRIIGRIAFPIFCFMLVEGYLHTRSKAKYVLRLGIFALISEIPFDLGIFGSAFYWSHQNVYFTLFLGLLAIWIFDDCKNRGGVFIVPGIISAFACMATAAFLKTDYDEFGVALILVLYLTSKKRWLQLIAGAAMLLLSFGGIERYGAIAFLLLFLYNGERGRQPKMFFYIFYPAHLLLIGLFGRLILPGLLP